MSESQMVSVQVATEAGTKMLVDSIKHFENNSVINALNASNNITVIMNVMSYLLQQGDNVTPAEVQDAVLVVSQRCNGIMTSARGLTTSIQESRAMVEKRTAVSH